LNISRGSAGLSSSRRAIIIASSTMLYRMAKS